MKNILSFGGGVNSTALYFYLKEKKLPLDLIIFADTGVEHQYTYDLIEKFKKMIDVEFVTVRTDLGNLYDYYFKVKSIPSYMKRDCTYKFKILPIRKYLRERFGKKEKFELYIAITFDEFSRMKTSDVGYIKNVYPFCNDRITRDDNLRILEKVGLSVKKSGCVGCIYNKKAEWIKMLKENKKEFMKYEKLDKNNRRYPQISLINGATMEQLRNSVEQQLELNIFNLDPTCDVAGGCFL